MYKYLPIILRRVADIVQPYRLSLRRWESCPIYSRQVVSCRQECKSNAMKYWHKVSIFGQQIYKPSSIVQNFAIVERVCSPINLQQANWRFIKPLPHSSKNLYDIIAFFMSGYCRFIFTQDVKLLYLHVVTHTRYRITSIFGDQWNLAIWRLML